MDERARDEPAWVPTVHFRLLIALAFVIGVGCGGCGVGWLVFVGTAESLGPSN